MRALDRRHRARARRRRARVAPRLRRRRRAASTRSPRTSCARCCTCRATRCGSPRFGLRGGAAGHRVLARALADRAGACAVRRRRRPRLQPARPADELRRSGMALICAGHAFGWPVAARRLAGDHRRARRRPARARRHGSRPDVRVARSRAPGRRRRRARPGARRAWPRSPATGCRPASPAPTAATATGPGAFKVDLAVEGGVPWTNEACRRAGTVHVGGTFEEVAAAERDVNRGRMPERPVRARRPAVPRRPDALRRRRPPGVGLRPRARPATPATPSRGHPRPDRALRPGPARADRRPRAARSTGRDRRRQRATTSAATSSPAPTPPGRCSSARGSRSTRTAPACPACSSARQRLRPAPARTA